MDYFPLIRSLIYKFTPEVAHNLTIWVLRNNLLPKMRSQHYPNLQTQFLGLDFSHPIGLSAGFDKNAECIEGLFGQGFSFVEIGTVTPKPQYGNQKPRLFRLQEDQAIINRLGFNNKGAEYFLKQLDNYSGKGIIGINIGPNRDAANVIEDYTRLIQKFYGLSSYITINISSPNTPGLRRLHDLSQLKMLITAINDAKYQEMIAQNKDIPILLKISPDITAEDMENIAQVALEHSISGLIVSNTTISRPENLASINKQELGGLSGRPLFGLSTKVLGKMYQLTQGKLPLIGSGGVFSGEDAYKKILAGASLIQIYSALIYHGFYVVEQIKQQLSELLERDGFKNIKDAVGKAAS